MSSPYTDDPSGYHPLGSLLGEPLEVSRFLPLAIGITTAVAELHDQNIIHKNITPESILINPESGAVAITGSSLSSNLPYGHSLAHRGNMLEEMFAYMSPEQTGRMNRIVDHRSDLYSLGIVLYEMITGKVPFQAHDALEWVHCHIARQPLPPNELMPAIPKPLSDIIMKLLAKTAEERYQTANGLKYDLEICHAIWKASGEITVFQLGAGDVSDRMLIPQKLYGRGEDIATLLGAFERVIAKGAPELIMISGYSGVGKTSLVRELYKPIVRENGLFISGKFDQYKSNIPYATFGDAFRELIRQILTESEERIAAWRIKLQNALGLNGQLIVDIIPQLEVIIGKQPPVPELSPSDAANRFTALFRQFIGVFTSHEHPLVLFLDDLQWADAASLKLLENIITDGEMKYLLLIGAFRDNEVTPSHPLILTLDFINRNHAPLKTITLLPLSFTDLGHLMADTFRPHENGFESLSSLIYEKTAGNPFFATQFLITLHEESLVEFDRMKSVWKWDAGRIHAKGYTDNVVDLMLGKLRKLAPETGQTLQLAACIGNSFDRETLLSISSISDTAVEAALAEALQERLLLQLSDNSYSFLHDRVQQAAYSLIPDGEQAALHLSIGRLMLSAAPAEALDEKVFDIVNQFNRGIDLITDRDERCRIARLNLIAGKKAKASTAYASALNYISLGAQLLDEDAWETEYRLCFEIHQELAEAEYLNSRYDLSKELIERLVIRAASDLERARLYNILIVQYTLLANYPGAITTGREALRLLHVIVPETDFQEALTAELRRYAEILGTRAIPSLADEQECSDPEKRVCLELLSNMVVPARYTESTLFALISVLNVNASLQYGPTPKSTVGYSAFGMVLNSALGNYKDAYAFGLVALQLSERFNVPAQKCQSSFMLGHYLNQWVRHLKWADATLNDGIQAGLASGEMQWTGYSMAYKLFQPFYRGEKLELVRSEIPALLFFTRKTVNRWATDTLVGLELVLSELAETDIQSNADTEAAFLAECRERRSFGAIGRYAVLKAQIHYLFGRYEQAREAVAMARELGGFFSSSISVAELNFFDSLILAALDDDAPMEDKAANIGKIRENQWQMRIWADNCPENFTHQYLLVEAELARLEGRGQEAMSLYEQSIASAREQGFIQNKGIANELASRYYRQRGFATSADAYLRQARSCYFRWGAGRKVKELDRENRLLQHEDRGGAKDLGARIAGLDAITIVKASQAISGKIILSDLLKTLMTVVLENAGAQKGSLLLVQGEQLSLAAEAWVESGEISVELDNKNAFADVLPLSMVNYVRRTKECLIIEDVTTTELFSADPYIAQQQPLSILCFPLVRQGNLIGLLYLENSLVRGAFTADMVAVLELLGAQATISLENAVLFQDRSRTEKALRQSEEKYRAIFEHCGTALIFIEEDTTISMCNMEFELLSGLNRSELEGLKKWTDFVADQNDLMRMKEYHCLRRIDSRLAPQRYEFKFLCNQGVLKDVAVTVTTIPETRQSLALMVDITERKRAEDERIRLATAIEQAAEGIFITDTDFQIQYANPACLRITGYSKEEFIGQHTRILKSGKHDKAFFRGIMEALNQRDVWSGHMTLKRKDGTIYESEASNTAVRDFAGTTINYVCIHRDITNEVRLERELRQSQKMEAIGTLAGGIAHDFNNILTAIIGYTEMAIRKLSDGAAADRDLTRVLEASSRAKDLASQILTYSHQSELKRKTVHVSLIIDEVLKLLRSSIPSTIEIRQRVAISPKGDQVLADPTQIHQVLMNLGTNAAHAMREHGGVLSTGLSNIDADASLISLYPDLAAGPCVRVTVSDTGHGMDAAVRERIFDPYFTTKKVGEGTGMGMAVVLGIIKSHGGAISVYSEPGEGTTFHIFLPRIDSDSTAEIAEDESYQGGAERILFVDDEEILTEMGQELLESFGYHVLSTTSSVEALNIFKADPSAIDLVITDMTMPGLTGKELAKELMAIRPEIPVILCTGFCETFNEKQAKDAGIREVVMKPYSAHNLDKVIRKVLAEDSAMLDAK